MLDVLLFVKLLCLYGLAAEESSPGVELLDSVSVKLSLSLHRQTTQQLSKEGCSSAGNSLISLQTNLLCICGSSKNSNTTSACASAAVLKIVTHLALERIPHTIICVGASHSYPYCFYSLCVPT